MEKTEVRIGGLGGQGVVLAGQILGRAAVYDGKKAVQTQSYGAEARGSLAKSEVIISNDEKAFPSVRTCDVLIAMNQEAVEKYFKDLKENGTLIVDSTNADRIPKTKSKILAIPATEKAKEIFGDKVYANMIILGALATIKGIVSEKNFEKAIEDTIAKKDVDINKQAFRKGEELATQQAFTQTKGRSHG